MTTSETRGGAHTEQMHGGDHEKYVCMDVSKNASLYEQNVTSSGQKHGAGSNG